MFVRSVLAAALLAAFACTACGGGNSKTMTATGIIFDVQAPSLTQLDGFTLHTDDDKTLTFKIAPEANQQDPQNGFVAGHLRTHALASTRVRITYRVENGELLATRIEDLL
jgi:hypothetical protein